MSLSCRMLYTDLLQLWDEAGQAVDVRDWPGALAKLEQITEPTSRTLFNTASAHLALGHLDPALKVRLPSCRCVLHIGPSSSSFSSFAVKPAGLERF